MKSKIPVPHFVSFVKNIKNFVASRNGQMIFASVACAFVFAFSVISLTRFEHNGQSFMASVANLNNSQIEENFSANLVLRHSGDTLVLIAGENMQKVDLIEGIIAFDPTKGLALSGENISDLGGGMYRFSLTKNSENITKGTTIATFTKNADISLPIMLTDTQFVSAGERYNLSNIVE